MDLGITLYDWVPMERQLPLQLLSNRLQASAGLKPIGNRQRQCRLIRMLNPPEGWLLRLNRNHSRHLLQTRNDMNHHRAVRLSHRFPGRPDTPLSHPCTALVKSLHRASREGGVLLHLLTPRNLDQHHRNKPIRPLGYRVKGNNMLILG